MQTTVSFLIALCLAGCSSNIKPKLISFIPVDGLEEGMDLRLLRAGQPEVPVHVRLEGTNVNVTEPDGTSWPAFTAHPDERFDLMRPWDVSGTEVDYIHEDDPIHCYEAYWNLPGFGRWLVVDSPGAFDGSLQSPDGMTELRAYDMVVCNPL